MPEEMERDDERTIEEARQSAFATLVDQAGGEQKANDLFTRMVADAFADHFHAGEAGDDEAADRVAAMTNTKLARIEARYRVIRI